MCFFKGRLSYDRHWTERDASVERVLKEVTEKIETISVDSEKKEPRDQTDRRASDESHSTSTPKSLSKKLLDNRVRDSLTVLSPLALEKSLTSSPSVLSPVFINMNRGEERDILDPRNIVMSNDSSITSLSQSCQGEEDPLNTSSICYESPSLIKFQKIPRVDVPKLRLPPTMFVGTNESLNCSSPLTPSEASSPRVAQSEIEDEMVKYELESLEEAEKKVEVSLSSVCSRQLSDICLFRKEKPNGSSTA